MTRSSVVLPTPLDPMSPVNSPGRISKETSSSTVATREGDAHPVDLGGPGRIAHRCSVEVPCSTAAWIAATSASIQDW